MYIKYDIVISVYDFSIRHVVVVNQASNEAVFERSFDELFGIT